MIKLLILIFLPFSLLANDLDPYKKTCSDIGFTPGTEKFAECVMDFFKQSKVVKKDKIVPNTKKIEKEYDATADALRKQNRLIQKQLDFDKKLAKEKERQRKFKLWHDLFFPPQQNYQNKNYTCKQRGNTKWVDCF